MPSWEEKKRRSSKELKLTPSKWKYCWLNAKHNTSIGKARQAEPGQHTEMWRNEVFTQELFSTGSLTMKGDLFWQCRKENKENLVIGIFHVYGLIVMINSGHLIKITFDSYHWGHTFKSIFTYYIISFLFLYVNFKHKDKQCSIVVKTPNSGHLQQVA